MDDARQGLGPDREARSVFRSNVCSHTGVALTPRASFLQLVLDQDDEVPATTARHSHPDMGRSSQGCRAKGVETSAPPFASPPNTASVAKPGSRYVAGVRGAALFSDRPSVHRDPLGLLFCLSPRLPPAPLQCPVEPRSSVRRGRRPREVGAGRTGTRDPSREGGQPYTAPSREGLGGSLPCACPPNAAKVSQRRCFSGWRTASPRVPGPTPVAQPLTWLARISWKLHGLLDDREARRGAP